MSSPISASANATVPNVKVAKALTSSDQAFTTGNNLAIGEVGTYTDTLTFPEGTTPLAQFVDQLPAGLSLVSLNSITASTNLNASAGTFNAVLSAATIPSNGSSFTLNFGNIANSDTTLGGSDTVVITYQAVVSNVASNTQGKSLTNTAKLTFTGGSKSASQTANVVLPVLTVSKSIDNASAQAGDTVTYTIVVSNLSANGSAADAFDLNLSDTLPADITYVAPSLGNTNGVAPTSLSFSNGSITADYSTLPLGSTSTLTFQAKVNTSVAALTPVTNTASLTYTTLAGAVTQPISPYDPNSFDRTGNPSDPGGAANNLDASGSASFTPPAPLVKTIVSTNQAFTTGDNVAIGEEVQYQIAVTIPQGTTPNAVISDTLPAGLVFDSVASDTFSPALSSSAPGGLTGVLASPSYSNNVVTWNLGTVIDSDTDSATAETITINYNVYVLNVSSNQSGDTLTNSAAFSTSGGSATASAPALTVVVPKLDLTETPSSSTADIGGAPVTFTVTVSHDAASTADAFDLNLADLVPAGFTVLPSTFQNTAGVAPASINQSGNTLSATYTSLALGQTSTLTFKATLNGTVSPGQKVTDTPSVTYSTLPGNVTTPQSANSPVSTERTGDTSDPGGAANNLVTTASAPVTATFDSIAGFVYVDANNDGIKQAGESGIQGVTVSLSGTDILNRPVTETTTTAANGSYTFSGLVPGTYTVTETQPSNYLDGKDTIGTPAGTNPSKNVFSLTLSPTGVSVSAVKYNFGELAPSTLSGYVYIDANDDGTKQGSETGIAGVTVSLTGTDDLNNAINLTTTTLADGSYSFSNLRPGTYTITETQPSGYFEGKDTIGAQGGSSATQDVFSNVVVTSGTTGTSNNFGELVPSSLSGFVYVDANDDGTKQAGESGIAGVTVSLTGTDDLNNAVSLTTTTLADGSYGFTNLRPGTYTITETQPAGYLEGKDTIGTPGGSSATQDVFSNVVVTSGTVGTNNNYGELVPSSLSGFVYVDANNDGIKQAGESGIAGVTITLTGTDDNNSAVNLTTTTLADGSYGLTNVRPGTYTITETQPAGYLEGKDTIGTPGGSSATQDVFSNVVVASGTVGTNNNFGEL
ncbi:MAG: beta strand repeat-containing protein, partial [Isosphaeraceae bacterium]